MDFSAIYAHANPDLRDALLHFRQQNPPKTLWVDGVAWEVVVCGRGAQTLLWLVGGLRVADAAFRSIPMLADDYRIIAPTYPPLNTMAALADGLAGILDAEGVAHAHILAGSFGGMVAQAFIRRQAARADKVILSTTSAPDPAQVERYRQERALLADLAEDVVRAGAKEHLYHIIAPPPNEEPFWRAYLDELFTHRLGKADLLSTYDCLIDFMSARYTPDDLADWTGQALILDSDDDATFDSASQARLRALYPRAQTYTFRGAGHSPASTQRDTFFGVVRQFLAGAFIEP